MARGGLVGALPVPPGRVGVGGVASGVMTSVYAERRARWAPGRFVACAWTQVAVGGGHRQLVVPDGCSDLIWHEGSLRLVGPDRGPWVETLGAGSAFVGVRLRPGAARLLVGRMPVDEVRDVRVPLEVVASGVARLTELAAAADSPEAVAGVLERYVAGLAARYEPDAAVEQVVRLLRAGVVPPHVPALADAVGLSERQLRRRFTEAVGYGPKTLHSILRFQNALSLGRAATTAGLADVAYRAGYADQAHFTREVRRLTGVTPTELLGSGE